MKKTVLLLTLLLVTASCPSMAKPHHYPGHDATLDTHPQVTCEMVRAYVAQAGLEQARAMAQAAGMTAADERRARRCLTDKI
jgi:hypothetical protein